MHWTDKQAARCCLSFTATGPSSWSTGATGSNKFVKHLNQNYEYRVNNYLALSRCRFRRFPVHPSQEYAEEEKNHRRD